MMGMGRWNMLSMTGVSVMEGGYNGRGVAGSRRLQGGMFGPIGARIESAQQ